MFGRVNDSEYGGDGKLNSRGFTLIEIMAVLVILSIMAAIAVPRFMDLEVNASDRAIDFGIAELNGREGMIWSKTKISPAGWQDDATLFSQLNMDLGTDYSWASPPGAGGGTLQFQQRIGVALNRTASTTSRPGRWERQ
jgi:prepilin-type N-terminal cleavage/methylation domain-containing protein